MRTLCGVAGVILAGMAACGASKCEPASEPEIDRALVQPDPDELFTFTSSVTPTQSFSVAGAVSDPDSNVDDANYYWFIDYPDPTGMGRYPIASGDGRFNAISINPCSMQFNALLDSTRLHLLELFVIDDNGALLMISTERRLEGQFAYVAWLLNVEAGVCK